MNSDVQAHIQARDYPLKEILFQKKYEIDYFQREYKWNQTNIEQMVYDLTEAFQKNYREGHSTAMVQDYAVYYMGTIVVCQRGSNESLVDGQQRITSLTLLLIFLHHLTQKTMEQQLSPLIYSDNYGEKGFNLNVPERMACLQALYEGADVGASESDNDSVRNMVARYRDIEAAFPETLGKGQTLVSFVYWLLNKVVMVKITAHSDENAYTIFETMNDRGLPLTPADMMKGYILSKYRPEHDEARRRVNTRWQKEMHRLNEYGSGTETQFFHAWLRSQYAESIRSTEPNAVNQDFENIGTRFHNWFKDNIGHGLLGSAVGDNMVHFMDHDYPFFLRAFMMIKEAENTWRKDLEHIYYINCCGIANSLSYPLMLSPLCCTDSEEIVRRKMDLVAQYIDLFVTQRSVQYHRSSHSSIRVSMYQLVRTIRNSSVEELKEKLTAAGNRISFEEKLPLFRLNGQNRPFVKYFLSRLTAYVEEQSGCGNRFVDYMKNPNCRPFELEHLWSDHFERYQDEVDDVQDFEATRHCIGAIVLLPNGKNQSYNDMPTASKLLHYVKENLLAASLTGKTYDRNPAFQQFINSSHLPFKAYPDVHKTEIRERCALYAQLAERVWPAAF